MKTITLRLTDNEAEALSRIAFLHGMSKNKLMAALIIQEYGRLTCFCEKPDPEENTCFLYCFPDPEAFAYDMFYEYERAVESGAELPITAKECAKRILRTYDYALENLTDPAQLERVEEHKQNTLEDPIIDSALNGYMSHVGEALKKQEKIIGKIIREPVSDGEQ